MTPMYKWSQLEARNIHEGGQKEVQNRTLHEVLVPQMNVIAKVRTRAHMDM